MKFIKREKGFFSSRCDVGKGSDISVIIYTVHRPLFCAILEVLKSQNKGRWTVPAYTCVGQIEFETVFIVR